ncbi:MAG TPA: hypothetical protein ENK63_04280 [Rhodobacterales bacterium]|nr:hypothetical protein [Rhodobacterales bacterium]
MIEIVVSERHRIDTDIFHRCNDRMLAARFPPPFHDPLHDCIADRVAMQKVAVIKQKRIGGLGARGADQRSRPRQARGNRRHLPAVVERQKMHMHICRRHEPQRDPRWRTVSRGCLRCRISHVQHPSSGKLSVVSGSM